MKIGTVIRFCCLVALLAGLTLVRPAGAEGTGSANAAEFDEMPVLTGEEWRTMDADAKLAFVLGVGHVVTIEENVMERHPELKRKGFVSKLGEGLRGVPMNSIISEVDTFYQANPGDLDVPVMRVIWRKVVKPRLSTGILDRPLAGGD